MKFSWVFSIGSACVVDINNCLLRVFNPFSLPRTVVLGFVLQYAPSSNSEKMLYSSISSFMMMLVWKALYMYLSVSFIARSLMLSKLFCL